MLFGGAIGSIPRAGWTIYEGLLGSLIRRKRLRSWSREGLTIIAVALDERLDSGLKIQRVLGGGLWG